MAERQFMFHSIDLKGRGSVREPMNPPTLRLIRLSSSKLVEVPMNEAQLLALLLDAAKVLQRMHRCRGAEVPTDD